MLQKIVLVYLIGIFASQPIYLFILSWILRAEDKERELYTIDDDSYDSRYMDDEYVNKPNPVGVMILLALGALLWPIIFTVGPFVWLLFWLLEKFPNLAGGMIEKE